MAIIYNKLPDKFKKINYSNKFKDILKEELLSEGFVYMKLRFCSQLQINLNECKFNNLM